MQTCPNICFITGTPQCGKTSFLLDILTELRGRGCRLGGFVAHGLWRDNERSGFDLEIMDSGLRVPLTGRTGDYSKHDGYVFYPEGFAVALKALEPAVLADKDIITVDEVGWLEIGGEGFAPAIPYLIKNSLPQIWVVRDAMIEGVCNHWQFTPALIVHPNAEPARNDLLNWFKTLA